jgi:segregation and condensation protein A
MDSSVADPLPQTQSEQPIGGYTVHIPVYEGPLDLLLELIEHAELDITKVALAQVTDQFLAYVHAMQSVAADELSAFLVIAAKLLQIKSEALLPRPPEREPGEEDIGTTLVQQLRIYKRFKEIANWLQDRELKGLHTYLRVAPPPKIVSRLDLSDITLDDLLAAAETIFAAEREKAELGTVIAPPKITLREKIALITRTLQGRRHATFRELIGVRPTRLEVVVTFLALLELVKRYRVAARQDSIFSEIHIEATEEFREGEELDLEFE